MKFPTNIYWLIDVRPETLRLHPRGRPFYCGKTIKRIEYRLRQHRLNSIESNTPSARYIRTIGTNNCSIALMEIVPAGDDWQARERRWIQILRDGFPGCVNVSAGGASGLVGLVGRKVSRQERRKLSRAFWQSDYGQDVKFWRDIERSQRDRKTEHRRRIRKRMREKRKQLTELARSNKS